MTGKLILSDVEQWPLAWIGASREALVMGTTGNGASAKGLYLFGPLPPIPSTLPRSSLIGRSSALLVRARMSLPSAGKSSAQVGRTRAGAPPVRR